MNDFFTNEKNKTINIVGANLILMTVYTLLLRQGGQDNVFTVAEVLALHIICCLLISPFRNSKAFLLSALALLLIGVSTCVIAFTAH